MIRYCAILVISLMLLMVQSGCLKERYRQDKRNKMTSKAKRAHEYLAADAKELTENNLKKKEVNQKKAEKERQKQQEELNELNQPRFNKGKNSQKHSGEFGLY